MHDELLIVVREALTNTVRHAHAHTILISLNYEPERVGIVVQDDGVGPPISDLSQPSDSGRHFGLSDMRQRIASLGGVLEVEPGDERGLRVRVSVPLPTETK